MDNPDESLSRWLLIRPYGCEIKMAGSRHRENIIVMNSVMAAGFTVS
ncbi:hypothetical protein [Rhizobium sp. SYY.PMSO]